MTKERAREILENWWFQKARLLGMSAHLPINDELVYHDLKEGSENEIEEFTFLYLIKIAYNLQDQDIKTQIDETT